MIMRFSHVLIIYIVLLNFSKTEAFRSLAHVKSARLTNNRIFSGTIGFQSSDTGLSSIHSLLPKYPIFKVFKKAVNVWGIIFGLQCWSIMCLWFLGMIAFMPFKLLFPRSIDKDGILIDSLGRWWSRLVSFPHSIPTVTGTENLPPKNEACIYIANHASWMDIPILGGFLPPLKFVCKKELTKV